MIFPLRSRSPPRPIFFAAERAEDKRMATYVYDYPSGSTASFYIDGEYVFPMSGAAPRAIALTSPSIGRDGDRG
jgi:hypothetical protein